jgi:pimeloyl-ACP methyl ester carboxylesterase
MLRLAALLKGSTNSKQVIAKNGGHHIELDDPELVTDAIRQEVNAFRRHTRRIK